MYCSTGNAKLTDFSRSCYTLFENMSERLKRILFIAGFVLFAIAIALAIYFVFFRSGTTPETIPTTPENPTGVQGSLPASGTAGERTETGGATGGLPSSETTEPNGGQQAETTKTGEPATVLLDEGISREVTKNTNGDGVRFYDPEDGKFYRINTDGLKTALSDSVFSNVLNIAWANTSDKAILTFPDGIKIMVDFSTNKQTTLPKHWEDFGFSSDDASVVVKSIASTPESRFLVISDPDGSNARAIEPIGDNASKTFPVWVPNDQVIAYATTGEAKGLDRQEILLVGKNHENFKSLLVEGRGFEPLWSPNGQLVLYSVWTTAGEYRPELWISGGAPSNVNQNRNKLGIQTWAHKCAWNGNAEIICAVPETMPAGAGLQPTISAGIADRFVRVNLETGTVSNLGKPEGNLSVTNPVVTKDGTFVIFSDASTGQMYRYRLL